METISIQASAPSRLSETMSITGCFAGDSQTENVNFAGIKTSDTPILFNGRSIGTVPCNAIMTSGNRIRASHGKLSDRSVLSMLKSQMFQTGFSLEILQSDGEIIQKSVLKSFDISSAGDVPQPQSSRTDAARTPSDSDDDTIAQRIFSMTRGCGSLFQSEQQPDRLNAPDSRSDADIADSIFIRSGGGDQRDPGGAARTQQAEKSDEDVLVDRLFAVSGGR